MGFSYFKLNVKPGYAPPFWNQFQSKRAGHASRLFSFFISLPRPVICCLLFTITPSLHAGGVIDFTSSDFTAGSRTDIDIKDGDLTLVKTWAFEGQAMTAGKERFQMGFAMDEIRNKALLFGGRANDDTLFGDTWLWDASSGWTQKTPAGPPAPRYGHGLVWAGDKFLLFGGDSGNDTWTYDITADTWTYIPASPSPSWRTLPALAYDSDLNLVVMSGGADDTVTWIYDVAASTWSMLPLVPAPPHRIGASMAYDRTRKKMVLFGGKDWDAATLLDDTWTFDAAAGTWTEQLPSSRPEPRWQSAMSYDSTNRSAFLYGGLTSSYAGDIWFYNFTANKWSKHYEFDPDEPAGRYGHGLIYDAPNKRSVIFGGRQNIAVRAVWVYRFLSTGTWTSAPMDVWAGHASTTPFTWDAISADFSDKPADTGALLQLASSPDGVTYGSYLGPDGTAGTFYSAGAPVAVGPGHAGNRFIKLKADLFSVDSPARPKTSAFHLAYNRAPYAPTLVSPADDSVTNDSTPAFKWNTTSDPDGVYTRLYQVMADTSPLFTSPDISEENIPAAAGSSEISFSTGIILPEGEWFWRVRAKDPAGLYGYWSNVYSIILDTHTPPGPVTVMSAARGPAINSAALIWTFPGDDKGRVDNGQYIVRFSSENAILTEGGWTAAQGNERTGLFSAAPGDIVQTTVTGLTGSTTYFFAIKTGDELVNISALSSTSPFMMTDSSPTVTLLTPNGAEGTPFVEVTTISWTQSDPNTGDSLTKEITLSSNSGSSYFMLIASGIAPGATTYLWNSVYALNGSEYRVKVTATDPRGLSAADSSDSNFELDNTNNPPSVWLTSAPAAGEEIAGSFTISWSTSDPNSLDTHTYGVLLSADSGGTFSLLSGGLVQRSYVLNSKLFPNRYTYRLKIIAADSGTPLLTGEALSPVFAIINTLPPETFSLIKPLEETFPSVFDLEFSWEPALDPEHGAVSYTLQYSTEAGPVNGISVAGLALTSYTPPLNSLLPDTGYYWKVTAADQYTRTTDSASGRFVISTSKARSADGMLLVETLSALPAQGRLGFRDARAAEADAIGQADRNSKSNRLVKILSYPVWDVRIRDINGTVLPGAVSARLSVTFPGTGGYTGSDAAATDFQNMKIAMLDESRSRWELPAPQILAADKRQVSASVSQLSFFSVMAAVFPKQILSGVTNFPNPFDARREHTHIRYALTRDSSVRIRVYTLMGDLVRVMECAAGTPGCGKGDITGLVNEIIWDGRNGSGMIAANGMYLAEIHAESSAGKQNEIRRIGVLK